MISLWLWAIWDTLETKEQISDCQIRTWGRPTYYKLNKKKQKIRKCINLSAHSREWTRKKPQGAIHRRDNIEVGAACNPQTIFGKSCTFEQNKIHLQIWHTLGALFPFQGCGDVGKFPQQLCERGSCAVLGTKETEMIFYCSLREPHDPGLAGTLPQLRSKNLL